MRLCHRMHTRQGFAEAIRISVAELSHGQAGASRRLFGATKPSRICGSMLIPRPVGPTHVV